MANVFDVAAYILAQGGSMTAMKLQKLTYYSQAWHLVWEEKELFPEAIEAWANGPVVYELYREHRGQFTVTSVSNGNSDALDDDEKTSIDAVLETYLPLSAQQLSELTHREDPWKKARAGVPDGRRAQAKISSAMMFEFYHGIH